MVLCQILAALPGFPGANRDSGYYDDVAPLSAYERRQMAKLPFHAEKYRRFLGVPALNSERGFSRGTAHESAHAEINGLTSGYQGRSKTIIPSWASAKSGPCGWFQTKAGQGHRGRRRQIRKLCPPTVRLTIRRGHGGEPYLVAPDGALAPEPPCGFKARFGYEAFAGSGGRQHSDRVRLQAASEGGHLLLGMACRTTTRIPQ